MAEPGTIGSMGQSPFYHLGKWIPNFPKIRDPQVKDLHSMEKYDVVLSFPLSGPHLFYPKCFGAASFSFAWVFITNEVLH